ncbi:hypothetical protein ACCO45_012398 [Purpureocillium lilacinum]|uniref:Uncharacterized protein n=1 Tax=Purpureocillium lilacinum TaxID=33203 RepID=A0ACC4D7X1_PURLI
MAAERGTAVAAAFRGSGAGRHGWSLSPGPTGPVRAIRFPPANRGPIINRRRRACLAQTFSVRTCRLRPERATDGPERLAHQRRPLRQQATVMVLTPEPGGSPSGHAAGAPDDHLTTPPYRLPRPRRPSKVVRLDTVAQDFQAERVGVQLFQPARVKVSDRRWSWVATAGTVPFSLRPAMTLCQTIAHTTRRLTGDSQVAAETAARAVTSPTQTSQRCSSSHTIPVMSSEKSEISTGNQHEDPVS